MTNMPMELHHCLPMDTLHVEERDRPDVYWHEPTQTWILVVVEWGAVAGSRIWYCPFCGVELPSGGKEDGTDPEGLQQPVGICESLRTVRSVG